MEVVTKQELVARLDSLKSREQDICGWHVLLTLDEDEEDLNVDVVIGQLKKLDDEEYSYSWQTLDENGELEFLDDMAYFEPIDCVDSLYHYFSLKDETEIVLLHEAFEGDGPVKSNNLQVLNKAQLIDLYASLEHPLAGCFSGRWIWIKETPIKISRIVPIGEDTIYIWNLLGEYHNNEFETAIECIENLISTLNFKEELFEIDPTEVFDILYIKDGHAYTI